MARPAEVSCMTFWNTRWEPSRMSSQVTPSAFLLKASQTFCATDSPSDEYQTTLPSFLAASNTAGSAASAWAHSPRVRLNPARAARSLRCVIAVLLSCPSPGSRRTTQQGGEGRDIVRPEDREQPLEQCLRLGGGEGPRGVDAELLVELLGRQRVLAAASRRILRLLQE